MTTFGDFEDGDSADIARPDPEAVARILWRLLREEDPARFALFDAHSPQARAAIVAAVGNLLARLERERA